MGKEKREVDVSRESIKSRAVRIRVLPQKIALLKWSDSAH